tara:strand:+ start:438 stop:1406 length:969 start_codon:yes stop_codon:yes gene_type:complete
MLIREFTNNISVNKVVEFDLAGAIDKMFGTEKPALKPGYVNQRPAGGRARKNWDARHSVSHNADGSPKFQDPSTMMPQTGTAPNIGDAPTIDAPPVSAAGAQDPTTMIPQVKPPVAQDPTQMLPQIPSSIIKGGELGVAKALSTPGWQNNLGDTLSKYTNLNPAQAQGFMSKVSQYALPAAGVLALLYGGKKLIDFMTRKKKRESIEQATDESGIMYKAGVKKYGKDGMKKIQSAAGKGASAEEIGKIKDTHNKKKKNETATAGATVAGNIASVANPKQAYGHRKRDKNGIPKAPQKKNPDGTAKSALDISDNLMGGKTIKR